MHPVVLKANVVMKTYYSLSCNQEFNGLYDCPLSNKSSFFKTKTLDIRKYDKYNNCPGLCVFIYFMCTIFLEVIVSDIIYMIALCPGAIKRLIL